MEAEDCMSATDQAGLEFEPDEATADDWPLADNEAEEAGCCWPEAAEDWDTETIGPAATDAEAEVCGAGCAAETEETPDDGCCGLTMVGTTWEACATICDGCCCCCWLAARAAAYCCCW